MNLSKEPRDQTAHVLWGLSILLPILLWPSLWTSIYAGLMLGLIREITEEHTPVTPQKVLRAIRVSKLDLAFWTFSGALAWFLTQ